MSNDGAGETPFTEALDILAGCVVNRAMETTGAVKTPSFAQLRRLCPMGPDWRSRAEAIVREHCENDAELPNAYATIEEGRDIMLDWAEAMAQRRDAIRAKIRGDAQGQTADDAIVLDSDDDLDDEDDV